MEYLQKYSPTNLSDFKSNFKQIQNINQFIHSEYGFYIISGTIASGKTTILDIISKLNTHETLLINTDSLINNNLKDLFDNFVNNKTISSFFCNKKKIICIDDINLIHSSDKQLLSYIKSFRTHISIIATVQSKELSKITDYKKYITSEYGITLNKITHQDCLLFVDNVIQSEQLYNINYDNVIKLIKLRNNDLRCIFHEFYKIYDSYIFSDTHKQETPQTIHVDQNIYDLTHKMFYTDLQFESNTKFYQHDLTLVSNIIHENLPIRCFKSMKVNCDNLDKLSQISSLFSTADRFDRHISSTYHWELLNVKNRYVYPMLNMYIQPLSNKTLNTDKKYPFTTIFTTLSNKTILLKQLQHLHLNYSNDTMIQIIYCLLNNKHDCVNHGLDSLITKIKKYQIKN